MNATARPMHPRRGDPQTLHDAFAGARAAVLVIDDEPGIREMLSFELSQDGFDVETAESGLAAVQAVKRRKFDLAVTDLKMPGMDGVATVEALRALDPDIEVIVATGYATVETAVACMKHGAYHYIQKPYDLGELKDLLDKAMQKSHLQGVVALYEASRALLSTLNPSDLVRLVVALAQRVLRADDIGLLLWTGGGNTFETHRLGDKRHPSDELLLELAVHVRGAGAPIRLPSPSGPAPALVGETDSYRSALVYPLSARERALGALAVLRCEASPDFSPAELRKGAVFASQLALSLDNARLHDDVARKVADLVSTREQLVQAEKLALAGHLAGSVAHEVNNPLSFVRANLDALRDYSSVVGSLWLAAKGAATYLREQPVPAAGAHARHILSVGGSEERTESVVREIAEVVDGTLDGVRRIADLVAGFQQLAEPGEAAPPERVLVSEVVQECLAGLVSMSRARYGMGAVATDFGPTTAALVPRGDLRTALLNLLSFLGSPDRRRSRDGHGLSVRTETREGCPAIVIHDSTLVLSDEERHRIFDPRVEVDETHGRTMRLNIALALSYQMLRRNGAEIQLGDDAGAGVRLRILLPPAPEEA